MTSPLPVPRRRWPYALVVVALLAGMAVAMLSTAVAQTPTIDEPVYVGAAATYTRQHSLRYNPEHPPLGKLIIGAGLAFASPRLDPGFAGTQEAYGRHLLYGSGNDAWRLMLLARLPVILLTLLVGLVVFAFATDLAGPVGGSVALALYAFSPDVIAHGSLATLDVPAAGFLLTTAWLLWRARLRPRRYLPLAGVALGCALATKMSALPAVPVMLLLAVLSVRSAGRATAGRLIVAPTANAATAAPTANAGSAANAGPTAKAGLALGGVAALGVAVLAVVVVWATYLAVDPRLRWSTPPDLPAVPGITGSVIDALPFPRPYRDGMRVQFRFEDATFGGFLFGRQYLGSRWYYLPAALLVKTPLGALALWLAGVAVLAAVPRWRPAAPYLLVPAAVLLAVAMGGARNFGVRYVIFLPMFLAVAAAVLPTVRRRWAPAVTALLVGTVAVSSMRTYPYYLPYANEAFGGPAKTARHLHDSNVDWGQDLGRLAVRLRTEYPGEPVWLVYKGSGVPAYYGITAADPLTVPPGQVRGLLVVSNSSIARAQGQLAALIDTSTPVDVVGHSITLFRRPAR